MATVAEITNMAYQRNLSRFNVADRTAAREALAIYQAVITSGLVTEFNYGPTDFDKLVARFQGNRAKYQLMTDQLERLDQLIELLKRFKRSEVMRLNPYWSSSSAVEPLVSLRLDEMAISAYESLHLAIKNYIALLKAKQPNPEAIKFRSRDIAKIVNPDAWRKGGTEVKGLRPTEYSVREFLEAILIRPVVIAA